MLWDHVKAHLAAGGTDGGNKIYQELARVNSRHTAQSWRDRWIKYLRDKDQRPVPLPISDTVAPAPVASVVSRSNTTSNTAERDRQADYRASAEGDVVVRTRKATPQVTAKSMAVSKSRQATPQAPTQPTAPIIETRSINVEEIAPSPQESANNADANGGVNGITITAQDEARLFRSAGDILRIPPEYADVAWDDFAELEDNTHHSASEWRHIWEMVVEPVFKQQIEKATGRAYREETPEHRQAATVEAPESPSNRAKANSSRRLTSGRTNASNSQSTGSQPTSQEQVSTSKAGTKRKRDHGPSDDVSQETRSRERSLPNQPVTKHIDKGKGKAVENDNAEDVEDDAREEDEEGNEADDDDDETLFIEDEMTIDKNRPPSPTLTEPRHANAGEDHAANVAAMKAVRKQARAKASMILPPGTQEKAPTSSNFSTTPPGATARQYVLSPTPRRNQPNSSSEFTTTTPGNTAPNNLASSAPEPSPEIDDSEESPESRGLYAFRKKYRGLGFSVDEINESLEAATNKTEYAEKAITHLHDTGSLPQDVQGVWTAQDDHDVMSNDSRERKRVEVKHTSTLRNLRLKHLDRLLNRSDSD